MVAKYVAPDLNVFDVRKERPTQVIMIVVWTVYKNVPHALEVKHHYVNCAIKWYSTNCLEAMVLVILVIKFNAKTVTKEKKMNVWNAMMDII